MGGGGVGEGGWMGGGKDGGERRIEVLMKIQKNNIFWGVGGVGLGWGWGVGGVGWGVRVDVNEELKFL